MKPVSGRTSTRAGISVEFPEGWSEVPLHGPFTRSYENREVGLNFDVSDFDGGGDSILGLGERMRQDLAREGRIVEAGTTTIDGQDAYRVFLEKRTSGSHGLVYGFTIGRPTGRITTVFLSSRSDERPGQREQIEALVGSFRVEP